MVRKSPYVQEPGLREPANALLGLLILQLLLGIGTWMANYALPWSETTGELARYVIAAKGYWESMLVTAHQATGSLLIASSTWLICRVARRQFSLVENRDPLNNPQTTRSLPQSISAV
jgi:heme A synthase